MTNAESVDKYRIVARHILAMRHRANCGVNRMKFITLTTVPYLLPFVKAELGDMCQRKLKSHVVERLSGFETVYSGCCRPQKTNNLLFSCRLLFLLLVFTFLFTFSLSVYLF